MLKRKLASSLNFLLDYRCAFELDCCPGYRKDMASTGVLSSQSIDGALKSLKGSITVGNQQCGTHKLAVVGGLESDASTDSIAQYLFGCAAMVIDVDFSIVTNMIGTTPDSKKALKNDIEKLLGKDNKISQDKREDERDPWILEGLGHMLLSLSRELKSLSVGGELKTLLLVHDDVKDHGIDLLGLCMQNSQLAIAIGEAKASKKHATKAATVACKSFSEIEQAKHDMHVRRLTLTAGSGLNKAEKALLCEAVWKDRRSFVPIISHDKASKFQPEQKRTKTFGALKVGIDGILLISVSLQNYDQFFDTISDKIRSFAGKV